jgi:pimeloyl-ACP methyl ester carboxylesterase
LSIRLLPNSRLDILNAGHFTWEDAPDAYADLVINLWQQSAPSKVTA